jgi:hypothetical protein
VAKPNRYVLGSTPDLTLKYYDENNQLIVPLESRLTVKEPDGTIVTYSGIDMIQAPDHLYVIYRPPVIGHYEYEGWGKDGDGRETASTLSFEIYDRLY